MSVKVGGKLSTYASPGVHFVAHMFHLIIHHWATYIYIYIYMLLMPLYELESKLKEGNIGDYIGE